MEITASHVLGNTWCLDIPGVMVPYYHLNEHEVILIDSGYLKEGELDQWMDDHGLRVRAILNTHNHWDHVAGNITLQKSHGSVVYMPKVEAAMASSAMLMNIENHGVYQATKAGFDRFPYTVDVEIGPEDGNLTVCDTRFQVIHTPGHSSDHVVYITPDRVMCVGDVLMSQKLLRTMKLTYAINHEVDMASKEKLRNFPCKAYILSHKSVETSIDALIDENIRFVLQRAEQIMHIVERPMSLDEITRAAWRRFNLRSGDYFKNIDASEMIHALIHYLASTKRLDFRYEEGVEYYARPQEETV